MRRSGKNLGVILNCSSSSLKVTIHQKALSVLPFKTYPKSNHALPSLQLTALAQDTIFSSLDSYSGLLTYVPEYILLNFFFTQEPG